MKRPIYVRPLSDAEREALEAGLRSSDAFVLRRCQILLASSRGENAYQIATSLGCNPQTVRNAIHAFNERGLPEALQRGSKRPHTIHRAFDPERAEALRELLHKSPREFGKQSSLWTMEMAAEVSLEEGLTKERVSGETIRALRFCGWGYAGSEPNAGSPAPTHSTREKKTARPANPPRAGQSRYLGDRFRRRDLVQPAGFALPQ
jgi:transposase